MVGLIILSKLVCITDPLSLRMSPSFQPQNKSYPQLLTPARISQAIAIFGSGQFSFLMVR